MRPCQSLISDLSGLESSPAATILYLPRTRRGSCDPAEWTAAHSRWRGVACAAVHSAGEGQITGDVLIPGSACYAFLLFRWADLPKNIMTLKSHNIT